MGIKNVADEVENAGISVHESDSIDDNVVDEAKAGGQSKTLHFKTKKNQNMERFYWKLVTIKSFCISIMYAEFFRQTNT